MWHEKGSGRIFDYHRGARQAFQEANLVIIWRAKDFPGYNSGHNLVNGIAETWMERFMNRSNVGI